MPYLITSDIHGSAEGLELIRSAASRLGADGIISAGDQCPSSPDPLWSILIAVRGNCDRFYEYEGIPFPPISREMRIYGRNVIITHGDRLYIDDFNLNAGGPHARVPHLDRQQRSSRRIASPFSRFSTLPSSQAWPSPSRRPR